MKICVICPSPDLEKFATKGDAHLLLTHLISPDNAYTRFYMGRKELKILDNGLFEHHVAAPTSEILQKAQLVRADVVIAPDVLYDAVGTVKNAAEFAKALYLENGKRRGRGLQPLQMMAVPQASNRKDYLWCYKQLVELGYEWIGLSILACPKSFADETGSVEPGPNRIAAFRALKETGILSTKVRHHLLGLGTHVSEVAFFAPIPEIFSNDSSSPILHGNLGIEYKDGAVPGGKRPEKMDFTQASKLENEELILKNIATWKKLATFEPSDCSNLSLLRKNTKKGWLS